MIIIRCCMIQLEFEVRGICQDFINHDSTRLPPEWQAGHWHAVGPGLATDGAPTGTGPQSRQGFCRDET
jgi:hypothetical protein